MDFWRILDPQTDPKTSITAPLTGGVKGAAREGSSNGFYNLIPIPAPLTFSITAPFPAGELREQ